MSTSVRCDGCGTELAEGDPIMGLKIAGPCAPDEVRPFGDYCIQCWDKVAQVLEVVEGLLGSE